jgi:hypothetical protein
VNNVSLDDKLPPNFGWAYIVWWLFKKPTSTATAWVMAVLAIFGAGALTALISWIIKPLGTSNKVPGYVFLIVGTVSLVAGTLGAWALTRTYYKLTVRTLTAEHATAIERLFKSHETQLESSRKAVRSLSIYAEHIYALLEVMAMGVMPLSDLRSDEASKAICKLTKEYLSKVTGADYAVSVCVEPAASRRRDRISDLVVEYAPGNLGERFSRKFEFLAAPHLTQTECDAFAVRIESSWLKHHQTLETNFLEETETDGPQGKQQQEIRDVQRFVYRAEYPFQHLDDDDIRAFEDNAYVSVCAVSFLRDDMIGYLVALSKTPKAFSEIEERYLLWLKRIIEIPSLPDEI